MDDKEKFEDCLRLLACIFGENTELRQEQVDALEEKMREFDPGLPEVIFNEGLLETKDLEEFDIYVDSWAMRQKYIAEWYDGFSAPYTVLVWNKDPEELLRIIKEWEEEDYGLANACSTIEKFAEHLNGMDYDAFLGRGKDGKRLEQLIAIAKEKGYVIVYGASDDLVEFGGAYEEEAEVGLDGGIVSFDANGTSDDGEVHKNVLEVYWCGMLYGNKKKDFYAVCILDIVEIVLIAILGSLISNNKAYPILPKITSMVFWKDPGYVLVRSFGIAFNKVYWQIFIVPLIVPLHWFAMRMILMIKKNSKSAWELLK